MFKNTLKTKLQKLKTCKRKMQIRAYYRENYKNSSLELQKVNIY